MKFKRKVKAEVEGGEAINVDGQGAMVEGPSHEDGGVDVELPEGTLVFSDRLTGPDGKTFAQREKRRLSEEKRAQKALEKNPTDLVSRFTLDRIMQRNNMAREAEMQIQQMAQEVDNFKYGGKVQYKYGGKVSSNKAREILEDGTVHGKPLTDKQKRFFGAQLALGTGPFGALSALNKIDFNKLLLGEVPQAYNMFNTGYTQPLSVPEQLPALNPEAALMEPSQVRGLMRPSNVTSVTPPLETRNREAALMEPGAVKGMLRAGFDGNAPLDENMFLQPTQVEDPLSPFPFSPPPSKGPTTADKIGAGVQTLAPLLGPVGLGIAAATPLITTIINRLGDKKPINQFEDFGRAALESNAASMRGAAGARDLTQRQVDLQSQTVRNQARQSARGISTLRALDQGISAQNMSAKAAANTQFYQNLSNLFEQRGRLQNQRDEVVMRGRKRAFDEQERQRDQFFTNLSSSLGTLGRGGMWAQKMQKTPDFWKLWGQ